MHGNNGGAKPADENREPNIIIPGMEMGRFKRKFIQLLEDELEGHRGFPIQRRELLMGMMQSIIVAGQLDLERRLMDLKLVAFHKLLMQTLRGGEKK